MIKVNKYMVCRITGETLVNVTLPQPVEQTIERRFDEEHLAIEWIEAEQAGQLCIDFIDWVAHKQHIAQHSDWYQDVERRMALEAVVIVMRDVMKKTLLQLCSDMVGLKAKLYKVLPAPGNLSFLSSKERLDVMVRFAEEKLQKYKLRKAS